MMRFELGLEEPDPKRALWSALTIAGAYIAGGLIPLSPYMAIRSTQAALLVSVVVTLAALLAFGYVKGRFTGSGPGGAPSRRCSSAVWPRRPRSGLHAFSHEQVTRSFPVGQPGRGLRRGRVAP